MEAPGWMLEEVLRKTKMQRRMVNFATAQSKRGSGMLLGGVLSTESMSGRQEDNGHANVARVRHLLNYGGVVRSPLQTKFHELCVQACLPLLFGLSEWKVHRREVLMNEKMPYESPLVFASLPRRFGKTVSLSIFTASILLVRSLDVLIFSMSSRAADALLLCIKEAIVKMSRSLGIVIQVSANSKQEFAFILNGKQRTVKSLPSKNVRGSGGDIVLLDEACFMETSLLLESVFPICERDGVVLIAISSPSPTLLNQAMRNLQMKTPEGVVRNVFRTLEVTLSCQRCLLASKADKCTHRSNYRPSWKDVGRARLFSCLYGALGQSDIYLTESLGIPSMQRNSAFQVSVVTDFFQKMWRPKIDTIESCTNFVIIGSDVSGGAHSSTCFIGIAAHEQLEDGDLEHSSHCLYSYSVVAIESTKQVGSNINKLLTELIKTLRKRFHGKPVIFAPESSIISFCLSLAETASRAGALVCYYETTSKIMNPGIPCTASSKDEWLRQCQVVLNTRAIRLCQNYICLSSEDREAVLKDLYSQVTMLRVFSKGPTAPPLISGKCDSSGNIKNTLAADDMAISFLIAISSAARLTNNPLSISMGEFSAAPVHHSGNRTKDSLWTFIRHTLDRL